MKEKIYTIPVTGAFAEECECPMCVLERKLEEEYIDYFLGPSLMEPDHRIGTNDKGFCRRHFELLYNRQENRLGLGLILDTHLTEQNGKLKKIYQSGASAIKGETKMSLFKNITAKVSSRQTEALKFIDETVSLLEELENKCSVCSKLDFTMDRYIDVILYLWLKEDDFRKLFNSKKGFCLRHFKDLLKGARKYLSPAEAAAFIDGVMELQLSNMERIQQEVNWFTKKFDYRNTDAPWGNSKDAVPRSIQKIAGYCNLK